jgi:hypothetical protein
MAVPFQVVCPSDFIVLDGSSFGPVLELDDYMVGVVGQNHGLHSTVPLPTIVID